MNASPGRPGCTGWLRVVQVRGDGSLQVGHQQRKLVLRVGGGAESTQDEGRVPDGFHARPCRVRHR
ncbi:hypothetical protein [Streptomyces flavidovirens]